MIKNNIQVKQTNKALTEIHCTVGSQADIWYFGNFAIKIAAPEIPKLHCFSIPKWAHFCVNSKYSPSYAYLKSGEFTILYFPVF